VQWRAAGGHFTCCSGIRSRQAGEARKAEGMASTSSFLSSIITRLSALFAAAYRTPPFCCAYLPGAAAWWARAPSAAWDWPNVAKVNIRACLRRYTFNKHAAAAFTRHAACCAAAALCRLPLLSQLLFAALHLRTF